MYVWSLRGEREDGIDDSVRTSHTPTDHHNGRSIERSLRVFLTRSAALEDFEQWFGYGQPNTYSDTMGWTADEALRLMDGEEVVPAGSCRTYTLRIYPAYELV